MLKGQLLGQITVLDLFKATRAFSPKLRLIKLL